MEVDLARLRALRAQLTYGVAVLLVLGFALLGRAATPVEGERPQVLTPQRWALAQTARQAHAEVARLVIDAEALRAAMAQEPPDAIAAMTLAQRVYVTHQDGTAATASARQTLIEAAAVSARYAAGGAERQAAIAAVNLALERIRVFASGAEPGSSEP